MAGTATTEQKKGQGGERGERRGGGGRGGRRRPAQEPREFDQRILELSRVTRVTAGGKRMRFRVCLIIGDRNGRVGYGIAKGLDVQLSVEKAFRQAKKHMLRVPFVRESIAFPVHAKYGASKIILKPAPKGTGIKSGGAVRVVLELAGVPNIVSKSLGSNNKINSARATFQALEMLLAAESTLKRRVKEKKDEESVK